MELMIYMLMKKLKSWGGSYDRSLGILVEELKSKAVGPKQEIIEDKFKEFMEEERQAG